MKIPDPSTDEQLAASARAGSVDAFDQLVRRYQVPLLRFLQRKSPTPREAEDLLQDSFLRAYQSLDKFKDGYAFKPWLFTLTYRVAISAARKSSIRPTGEAVELLAGRHGDPVPAAEAAESRTRLWDTVRDTLGDESFTALWLFYVEDIPPRQIATIMGRSWVWVKQALHRARKKLHPVLSEEDHRTPGHTSRAAVVRNVRAALHPTER
jgi:RNA polymerase sigma-70 factor (ECF subfamily)